MRACGIGARPEPGCANTLTMNRPQSLNALNWELVEALRESLEQAAADHHVHGGGVNGAGRGLSSEQDLVDVSDDPDFDIGEHLRRYCHPPIRCLAEYPKPTVAGYALGMSALPTTLAATKIFGGRRKVGDQKRIIGGNGMTAERLIDHASHSDRRAVVGERA